MRTWLVLLTAAGCAPGMPDRYLAIDGRAGDYGLAEVEIPELEDPVRMLGSLGNGRVGGYLAGDVFEGRIEGYRGGSAIRVQYAVEDGVGVPFDQDGVVLWSYYHSLSAFREELEATSIDTSEVFPVPFAYQPSLGGAILSSNAAYVADVVHLFVLLPDGVGGSGIPLAANPGVIRHEFGHALFQHTIGGGVARSTPQIALPEVSALNEGFADMVASLAIDDPDFITPSIDLGGARDLTGDHTLADTLPPDEDPYSRGTVYASFTWDLRVLTDDPQGVLTATVRTLEEWAADAPWDLGQPGVDRFPAMQADRAIARWPAQQAAICDAFAFRFETLAAPSACP